MMIMLEFKFLKAITYTSLDESLSDAIKHLRVEAFRKLRGILSLYEQKEFYKELIEKIWDKKAEFINEATSAREIDEILKVSLPIYNYGNWQTKTQYHVEEEELLMWAHTTPGAKVSSEASARYLELFKRCLPEVATRLEL